MSRKASRLTPEERRLIEEALREGAESQHAIAKRFGRDPATVHRVAKAAGLNYSQRCDATKAASQARRDYAQAERLELINELLDLIRATIAKAAESPDPDQAHKLQALATAMAIAVDKRRLEEGEATARTEHVQAGAKSELMRRIDELAERRRRLAAG